MDRIAWNQDLTGPVTTVTQLLDDPKFKGKIGVWSSMGTRSGSIMLETEWIRRRSPTSRSTG